MYIILFYSLPGFLFVSWVFVLVIGLLRGRNTHELLRPSRVRRCGSNVMSSSRTELCHSFNNGPTAQVLC